MAKVNQIIQWDEFGSTFKLYVRHYGDENGKIRLRMIFEDATRDVATEIDIPSPKVREFLKMVNGNLNKHEMSI